MRADQLIEIDEPAAALRSCQACLSVAPRNLMAMTFMSIALDRLGDRANAARIVDFDKLIQCKRFVAPAGYESISEFNDALAQHVRSHPTLRTDPVNNATQYGKHTDNLLVDPTVLFSRRRVHCPRQRNVVHTAHPSVRVHVGELMPLGIHYHGPHRVFEIAGAMGKIGMGGISRQ